MLCIKTDSTAETERFACAFAQKLRAGDILAFRGGLGVGKTAFVRGLAAGLHCEEEVSSPTFALVHEYGGNPPLYHFDMYRIHSMDDLDSTGFFDYLDAGGILAVEWSENIMSSLTHETVITVEMERTGENTRVITIHGGERF